MAPVKRPGSNRRTLEDVKVSWVSHDGLVVEAETIPSRPGNGRRHSARIFEGTFACSLLRRPGSAA